MQIADNLEWQHIYWVNGVTPKGSLWANAVKDPPTTGWQHAMVLTGEKRSTLFCPYTFKSWSVNNDCMEISQATEPKEFRRTVMLEMMRDKWESYQTAGLQVDYDTAALIFKRMDEPVPAQIMTGGGEDNRKKGGKETGSELLKPVKAESKRGKFLQWFIDGENSRSVREAMAELSMSRSNVLSYLYMLQKDHGIGYDLVGDMATINMPVGCTDPFNAPIVEEEDDSWLD